MNTVRKTIFLASLVSFAAITTANAADLPDELTQINPEQVTATAYDWGGVYVGANLGFSFEGDFDNNFGANLSQDIGFLGGGVIGYNHQIDKFVIGLEADLNYLGGDADSAGFNAELDFLGTVTARVGYTPVDRVLTYIEGGYAFGQVDIETAGFSDDRINSGFVVGAGAEYAITDKIISGIEYNYVDLQDRAFALGGGTSSDFSGHNIKFNLKYKF